MSFALTQCLCFFFFLMFLYVIYVVKIFHYLDFLFLFLLYGVVSEACFNFILQLTAELQIIRWYYVSKRLELQLMNLSYCQILWFDSRSETWDIIRAEFKFWWCSKDHYRKYFNRFVYLYIGTKIVETIDMAAGQQTVVTLCHAVSFKAIK